MNQCFLLTDEDQDSLFGSPPPSPGRGRSPSQEASVAGEEVGLVTAVPNAGVGRKNVGTIALPGSHMSCAELPAHLSASSMSLPRPTSSRDSPSIAPPSITATSRSSTRSVPSRASSATSSIPSPAAPARKRRTSKAKSLTPAPPALPITLPGPNEPTPANFLRSQSSLLGLAGVVGCVKPTQLYTHTPQPTPVQQSRSHSPARGSTPTHPIVLDDDQDTQNGKGLRGQLEMPPRLDQLNPQALRSNILSSLAKEKNIFPVLESLVKLLGDESRFPSRNPPSESFARPYGHGIFNVQSSSDVVPPYTSGGPPIPAVPPTKRRKLKHVPAGAADWDVPFPFAAGEGPEAYRDNWAQDRARRLVVQLLELVRDATKRATIKTAKSGQGWAKARSCRSSRSTSVETQIGQASPTGTNIAESTSRASITPDSAETPSNAMPMDTLYQFLGSSEGVAETGSPVATSDHLGFEEWLSQLQKFLPLEADTSTLEPLDRGTRLLAPLDCSVSGLAPTSIPIPTQHDALTVPHSIQDQAIDPTLLAISQQAVSPPQSQLATSPTSALVPGDIPQALQISSLLPVLSHTPRTSFSSVTGPLTPPCDAPVDAPAITTTHAELVHGSHTHEPVEKDDSVNGVLSPSPTELSEPPSITAVQKGKATVDGDVISTTSKGALDKQAILERARMRREQLVAEIERAKLEMWETNIESAVLVHLTRDRQS